MGQIILNSPTVRAIPKVTVIISNFIPDALENADYIFHAAGSIMGLKKEDCFQINVDGTRNLLEALLRTGSAPKRFLLVSSLAASSP